MIFECWCDDEGDLTVSTPQGIQDMLPRGLVGCNAIKVYSIVASSWSEAMALHHEAQGWEPYVQPYGSE